MTHHGIEIVKTGKAAWDYRVKLGERYRWGTIEECKQDIEAYLFGLGLPSKEKGSA